MTKSAAGFERWKFGALSGVTAGNAALYAVGRSGNNLPYSHKFVPLDERR